MRVYTAHVPPGGADRDTVLVKEGFSWPAFLVSVPWALALGLWVEAAGFLIAGAVVYAGLDLAGADFWSRAAVLVAYQVLVGYAANDLRRRALARRGFTQVAVVCGADRLEAERRFFEAGGAGAPAGKEAAAESVPEARIP